jgi:hypothetical protein
VPHGTLFPFMVHYFWPGQGQKEGPLKGIGRHLGRGRGEWEKFGTVVKILHGVCEGERSCPVPEGAFWFKAHRKKSLSDHKTRMIICRQTHLPHCNPYDYVWSFWPSKQKKGIENKSGSFDLFC